MLIEKIDCVFIWAGDKMIDCRQLGRWNCSAALRITEGLFSPPLLPHLCTTPFVFLSVAPSPFHWSFSVSREFSTVMGHFCPLQTPGGKIFKLRSEQRESTCVYNNGQVLGVYRPLLCCCTFLVLKSSAVLSSFSLSQHCTSHLHVHAVKERSRPRCVCISASHIKKYAPFCTQANVCREPKWVVVFEQQNI